MNDQGLNSHLKMHTRIKLSSEESLVANDIGTKGSSSSIEEQTLKLKHCKYSKDELSYFDDEEIDEPITPYYFKNESFLNIINTLSDDDVITFFNSHLKPDRQCISIIITRVTSGRTNFSYCVQFNNCYRKLPFICKFRHSTSSFSTNNLENKNTSHRKIEFYPDTLRNYQQDPKMSYVINSLLAVVYGLDRIYKKVAF